MGKKGGGPSNSDDLAADIPLQAVILGDSFNTKFRPVTLELPRALIPLVNVPLIEYTLEFLASNNVEEVFVFAVSHAAKIEGYIARSKWGTPGAGRPVVKVLKSDGIFTTGDALREIERLAVIRSDFILVSGDVVSNMRLEKVLEAHRLRRETDKQAIMTMVLKKTALVHKKQALNDNTLIGVDPATSQLVHYERKDTPFGPPADRDDDDDDEEEEEVRRKKTSDLDLSLVFAEGRDRVQVRADLFDTHIDIVSPEFLYLFTDNFDYQDRGDFIRGVLSADIMGDKIHTHVLTGEYAARARDFPTYDQVSRDIIHRWAYPMVPDNNLFGPSTYTFKRHNLYMEASIMLAGSADVQADVVIGAGTVVGEGSVLRSCVLGRGCTIGAGVIIEDSYVWDDVTIGEGAVVRGSMLATGSHVGAKAQVERGVLSFNTAIGEGHVLQRYSKITLSMATDDDLDDGFGFDNDDAPAAEEADDQAVTTSSSGAERGSPTPEWLPIEVGMYGAGRVWPDAPGEDPTFNSLGRRINKVLYDPNEDSEEDDWSSSDDDSSSDDGDDVSLDGSVDEEGEGWRHEMYETVMRNLTGKHTIEELKIEIQGVRLGQQRLHGECGQAMLPAFFDFIPEAERTGSALAAALRRVFGHGASILADYVSGSQADQVGLIAAMTTYMEENKSFAAAFPFTLQLMYDKDVLTEEAILEWEEAASGDAVSAAYVTKAATFLTWLKEADEDSSDEE